MDGGNDLQVCGGNTEQPPANFPAFDTQKSLPELKGSLEVRSSVLPAVGTDQVVGYNPVDIPPVQFFDACGS